MLLQWLWFGMMAASIGYALVSGNGSGVLSAALQGAGSAVELCLRLCAGYIFFCGLIEILSATRAPERLNALLRPALRRLMPALQSESAFHAVTLNLTANLLGLGNAATPTGIEAMRRMEEESGARVRHAMYMLLILNATSIQLLPTTVLSLRVAAGSLAPNAILLPSLLCTCVSTAVGVTLGTLCRKREERLHG